MRFLADGPAIPDELLFARDEGRVIFFCGAGVSRARACLPDFFGLATNMVDRLHVERDSAARKLIHEAAEIAKRVGEGGLISADRIFGLLERHFSVADIHAAVAQSVAPAAGADLSVHRMLLDLARGADDKVRLVTTNFDLLFEACNCGLQSWEPSRLPDPLQYDHFNGVIHLHGRVNASYTRSIQPRHWRFWMRSSRMTRHTGRIKLKPRLSASGTRSPRWQLTREC
jgi:NAD-dependent SIR2 family protein deacetylase